ncbi:MAG: ATP synthase F0 subunit B [Desulfobacterales bacterium]|jgi:F-type H+-transporting ATPase subunit b
MKISGFYRKGLPTFIIILIQICLVGPKIVLGASGESGGGGVTVIPDGSIIIQIVNFLFAIWVLNVLLYKPIRKILTQRKEKVSGLELAIETSNKDVKEKDDAFAAGIKEARTKGFKEKDALLQQAADEEKSILDDINRKAQAELAEIRDQIKNDAEVARESLQAQIGDFANQISQKILGRAV